MAKPDNRPLDGVSVVVCRAAQDAESLLDDLRRLGATPIAVPLHVLAKPADGGQALRCALDELDGYQWLAVTSANGARSVLEALGERTWPADLQVAAVGPATARAFTDVGIDVDLVASPSTAADLAAALVRRCEAGSVRVLAPLAEAADDVLVDALRGAGHAVDRVDAYRMAEPPASDGQRDAVLGAQAVLFTAPSIVDRFIDRFSLTSVPPIVVSIGPRTTTRSRARGLSVEDRHQLIEAEQHDGQGLIEALVATIESADPGGVSPSPRWTGSGDAASGEAAG